MKKVVEKKIRPAVENYWQELVNLYFEFYKRHFRDQDGFAMSPDWNPQKIGMEAGAFKKIIIFLRQIAETKKIDWTLEYAKDRMTNFLERAYSLENRVKFFYCALLNRNKADILCSSFNPHLSKKILELWYFKCPEYTRDIDKDRAASEIIIGFLKQQYILNSLEFEERSVLQSVDLIFRKVKEDEWWNKKSLKSIANHLQEFVNKIKSERNGNSQTLRRGVMDELNRRKYE